MKIEPDNFEQTIQDLLTLFINKKLNSEQILRLLPTLIEFIEHEKTDFQNQIDKNTARLEKEKQAVQNIQNHFYSWLHEHNIGEPCKVQKQITIKQQQLAKAEKTKTILQNIASDYEAYIRKKLDKPRKKPLFGKLPPLSDEDRRLIRYFREQGHEPPTEQDFEAAEYSIQKCRGDLKDFRDKAGNVRFFFDSMQSGEIGFNDTEKTILNRLKPANVTIVTLLDLEQQLKRLGQTKPYQETKEFKELQEKEQLLDGLVLLLKKDFEARKKKASEDSDDDDFFMERVFEYTRDDDEKDSFDNAIDELNAALKAKQKEEEQKRSNDEQRLLAHQQNEAQKKRQEPIQQKTSAHRSDHLFMRNHLMSTRIVLLRLFFKTYEREKQKKKRKQIEQRIKLIKQRSRTLGRGGIER